MSMAYVIQTEILTKHYGEVHAVDDVNLCIKKGEIYGFLGLNGAGKTTTIRMLLGMIRPTLGTVYLFGKKALQGDKNLWNKVGHLVEIPYSYPELTVLENLEIFRRLRFLRDAGLLNKLLEELNLNPYRNIKAKNLSLGNAQRLGIAKAMIHKPDLLILDEPANGLDPAGIVQIREILIDLALNHGVTIFLSSHILGEISRFATRIGIIHEGKMVKESEVDTLEKSRYRALHVNTLNNAKAYEIISKHSFSSVILPEGTIALKGDSAILHPEKISALLSSQGLPPTEIVLNEENLEHYFLRIIQTNGKKS